MLRAYVDDIHVCMCMRVCVFAKCVNFKLFIGRKQLNWSEWGGVRCVCGGEGGGAWPAAYAHSRTSALIARNVNTEKQRVRVQRIVCERAKKSKTEGDWGAAAFRRERQRAAKTSTAAGDKQQPRTALGVRRGLRCGALTSQAVNTNLRI